jgi:hypothetical protein
VRQGGDPVADKRVQIQRASHTFGALADQYLERRRGALRPHSWYAVAHHLSKNAAPLPCPPRRHNRSADRCRPPKPH